MLLKDPTGLSENENDRRLLISYHIIKIYTILRERQREREKSKSTSDNSEQQRCLCFQKCLYIYIYEMGSSYILRNFIRVTPFMNH